MSELTWPFDGPHEDDRLSALLDDELSEDDAIEVSRHVAECPRCFAELEEIRGLRSALRDLPAVSPPADLHRNIIDTMASARRRVDRRARRVAAAIVASAAVAGAVVVLSTDRTTGTVQPPVDVYLVDHLSRTGRGPVLSPVDLGR